MRVEGAIVPKETGGTIDREVWRRLVATRPEFRRNRTRHTINPFTLQPMTIQSPPDAARVIVDGILLGTVDWSPDGDDPRVNVSVEPSALPLVKRWAVELGGQFVET